VGPRAALWHEHDRRGADHAAVDPTSQPASGQYRVAVFAGGTAQRSATELATLYGLSQTISAEVAIDRILHVVAQTTAHLLNVPVCAERTKGGLLGSVSHDLRTPLAVIKGAVTNLLDDTVAWDAAARRDLLHAYASNHSNYDPGA
jgi:two-component system sensor histidine kinase KdpD